MNYSKFAEELAEFYKGATHSDELQDRLDSMKDWTDKRLAMAAPAWAKPKFLPKTFKPNFSQVFPAWTYADTTCKCTRDRKDFDNLRDDMTTEQYVAAWNERHRYGKAIIHAPEPATAPVPSQRKPKPFDYPRIAA